MPQRGAAAERPIIKNFALDIGEYLLVKSQ